MKKAMLAAATALVVAASACGSSGGQVVVGAAATTPTETVSTISPVPTEPVPALGAPTTAEPAPAIGLDQAVEPLATADPTAQLAAEPDVGAEPVPAFAAATGDEIDPATDVATDDAATAMEIAGPTAQAPSPELAGQPVSTGPVGVPVPYAIGVPAQYDEPPVGEPLCVVDIVAPDTLNIRSGPGVAYDIAGSLRPDACILRSAGPAVEGWQPVHAMVATDVLVIIEGWVSSNFVLPAVAGSSAEAAVVARHHPLVLSVRGVGGDPLLAVPCEQVAVGNVSCVMTGWFWEVASSPCVAVSDWKLGTSGWVEAQQAADGSWTAKEGLYLVLDC